MGWRILPIVALFGIGCAATEPAGRVALGERGASALVALGEPAQGPPGSDAVPETRVAFRMADGSLRPVDRDAIAFVPRWRDAAALVDPERRLYEVRPDGMRRMLAAGATGTLAVSADEALLLYVIERDFVGELRVHDGTHERVLASDLASIGVVRVEGARVLFVGGAPGGVVGVWTAALDGSGARCLTNCDLVTGTDWRARFVPPPTSAGSFELRDGVVLWTDHDGARYEAALGEDER